MVVIFFLNLSKGHHLSMFP